MAYYDFGDYALFTLIGAIVVCLVVGLLLLSVITAHSIYIMPDIEADANTQCKDDGYDTFESIGTKGIWPKDYVYVKCKFVDNRRDVQGNLNIGGN